MGIADLCNETEVKLLTVELGVFVPYPEEGKDAKDHRRPSALQRREYVTSLKSPI